MSEKKDKQKEQLTPIGILDRPVVYEVGGQEIKLTGNIVKDYLTRGNADVTDQELVMFINLCKYQKLNPFLNEAYLVKFGSSQAQIITSKEAYMKRAFANPNFEGMRAGVIVQRGEETLELEGSFSLPGDVLLGGWAEIHVKGKKESYITKITMDEFEKGQATWKSMPRTMIRKTALVQALREAFPGNLGAMYTEDEEVDEIQNETQTRVEEEIEEKANKEFIDIPDEDIIDIEEEPPAQKRRPEREVRAGQQSVTDLYEGPGF